MFRGIGEVPQQAKQHGSAYTGLCCFGKVRPHLPCLLLLSMLVYFITQSLYPLRSTIGAEEHVIA